MVVNLYTIYKVSILNGCGDIFDEKFGKKEKGTNKSLSSTVVEISLTKNLERKKKEQTKGRTIGIMPICNPTIQIVVVDLYTKYEVSILNGCGDIFDEKVLRNYGRTDGTTDRCKPVYPPLFQSGGIIKERIRARSPILNPTIQQLIVHVYTKFQDSSYNSS